jgi:hypothetical protein
MLINKFQRRQEKAKGREEWARCNEGHWRCPFFKYCWEEGIKLPMAEKDFQSATGLVTITAPPRRFASMTEGLQSWITVNSIINRSKFINGWGARPVFMIGYEAESMKGQTIG